MRLCGLLLIFCAPVLTGFYISRRIKRAITQLDAFYTMITEIRRKIHYLKLPLGEIFAGCETAGLGCFSRFLKDGGFDLALEQCRGGFCFSEEIYSALKSFAAELGRSGSEEQLRNCDIILETLRLEREKLAAEAPDKIRIATSLGFMSGTMLLIILL